MPIEHVQSICDGLGGSSSALVLTLPSAVTSGNLIVVSVSIYQGATATVSDNQGNTYTLIGGSYYSNAGQVNVGQYYAENVTGGTVAVTITPSGSTYYGVNVTEYSGALTSGSLDASGNASINGGGVGTATSASIHVTQGGVLVACFGGLGTTPMSAIASNIRGIWQQSQIVIAYDKLSAATGTDAASIRTNRNTMAIAAASFKPVSAGGGGGGGNPKFLVGGGLVR